MAWLRQLSMIPVLCASEFSTFAVFPSISAFKRIKQDSQKARRNTYLAGCTEVAEHEVKKATAVI
jgi:hypothetical protein